MKKGALGRALVKDKHRRNAGYKNAIRAKQLIDQDQQQHKERMEIVLADRAAPKKNMGSVTHINDLEELMENVTLADEEFVVEKQNLVVLTRTATMLPPRQSPHSAIAERATNAAIRIPRRPKWTEGMTAAELDKLERKAFLDWRRELAHAEERDSLLLTPFEKNLEIWRQLWRVVERSDAIIQVVDCRDPTFFRCEDLDKYINEVDPRKKTLLLLNKADLLSDDQRFFWGSYLKSKGIDFVFFSALNENKRIQLIQQQQLLKKQLEEEKEKAKKRAAEIGTTDDDDDDDDDSEDENEEEEKIGDDVTDDVISKNVNEEIEIKEEEKEKKEEVSEEKVSVSDSGDELDDMTKLTRVYTTSELLDRFVKLIGEVNKEYGPKEQKERVTIGMIGYPNVGKSSTINALCGEKRVAVTSTPGKTKHFQTLILTPQITLCDCPGLVFPTFLNSKAEMVCNGVLSIDQCSDYISPVALVCQRIPHDILCSKYGVTFTSDEEAEAAARRVEAMPDDTVTDTCEAARFLAAIARSRGFTTSAHGAPDQSRSARKVIKDYIAGTLFYAQPPPGISPDEYEAWRGADVTALPIPVEVAKGRDAAALAGMKTNVKKGASKKTSKRKVGRGATGEDYTGTVHMAGKSGTNDYRRTQFKYNQKTK